MSVTFSANHNANDFSEYTSSSTNGGDLSTSAPSALAGTAYGMSNLVNDGTVQYGLKILGANNTTGNVRARVYIDPNTLSISSGDGGSAVFFNVLNDTGSEVIFSIKLMYDGASYFIRGVITDDSGVHQESAVWSLTDAEHYIEVEFTRATGASDNNATLECWIDGAAQTTLTGVDSYTRSTNVRYYALGKLSVNGTVSGTYYLDELVINDDGSAIGPVSTPDVIVSPTFVAAGAQTVTLTTGATLSPALPAGWKVNDLLVMIIAGRCNGSTITNTFSNTWTLHGSQFFEIGAGATDLWIGVYTRLAQNNEAAPTVTPDADFLTSSTTGGVSAQIAGFRTVGNVLDVAAQTNSAAAAATWTPPSVTTVNPYSLIVSCVATSDDNALNHNTANSFTLVMSGASYDTTTGSDHAVGMSYLVKTTPGAVTMNIWNESAVGNDAWVGVTLAFTYGIPFWTNGLYARQAINRSTNF